MKVVHLITDLDIGGAELALATLLERFAGRAESTVVALGTLGVVGDRIRRAKVPVHALGLSPTNPNPFLLLPLVRLLREIRPDILQTWLFHADFAGLIAGTLARVPNVVWNIRCAELAPRDHPRSLPHLLRVLAFASRWPSAVICNSQAGREAHKALGYSPRRWVVIPNGFDTSVFRPESAAADALRSEIGLPRGTLLVGILARFHPMKDHKVFLEAARAVAAERADVHFVAAGRGILGNPALASVVRDLDLGNRVHLLAERTDAPHFLAGSDLLVSSSYGEAFPNVVGEAMACGTPCVVTDVGDSADLVGSTGIVVPPRKPPVLANAILRMLALSEDARATLGSAARERISSKFSLDRAVGEYERLYFDITRRTAAGNEPLCAE